MAARINAAARRRTVNTPGFTPPKMDHGPAQPDAVARTEPNPRLAEPPPAGAYALRPVEKFALSSDPHGVRAVQEADLAELFGWGIPAYAQHYPAASVESMLPLVRRAIQGMPYRALRTDEAFGIFMIDQKPWHAAPIAFDVFLAWQDWSERYIHQAVLICRVAREWARSIKASEFQLIECFGNLAPLAKRLGEHEITNTYAWKL